MRDLNTLVPLLGFSTTLILNALSVHSNDKSQRLKTLAKPSLSCHKSKHLGLGANRQSPPRFVSASASFRYIVNDWLSVSYAGTWADSTRNLMKSLICRPLRCKHRFCEVLIRQITLFTCNDVKVLLWQVPRALITKYQRP